MTALLVFSGSLVALGSEKLVGTWKLVSASISTASGERNDGPFGPSPTGFLTYTREGRMSAIISFAQSRVWDTIKPLGPSPIDSVG